ncbi:MAG: hypothetical protein GF331_04750 [Chitinivibrionales bacterium]|nr:hypothetical protein [Chitinivibrionales bacterium]
MNLRSVMPVVCLAVAIWRPCTAQDTLATGGTDMPSGVTQAYSTLSGELPEVVAVDGSPYVVVGDIVVPPGKTVTIEPGTFLLFKNFTGVQVHGTLIAAGTKDAPIAFTSENDKRHGSVTETPPAPYDWNGVTVTENAIGTTFEFCRIGYSLYGINALTEYFTIENCLFRKNGKSDVTIKGVKQEVASGVPYSYKPLGEPPVIAGEPGVSPTRITLRTSSIALLVVGCAVGVWQAVEYDEADARYEQLNDDSNLANLRNPNIVEEWDVAQEDRNTNALGMALGFCGAALGAVVFTITLF